MCLVGPKVALVQTKIWPTPGPVTFYEVKIFENLKCAGWRVVWATNKPNLNKSKEHLKSWEFLSKNGNFNL
jgi:hypothetical protein